MRRLVRSCHRASRLWSSEDAAIPGTQYSCRRVWSVAHFVSSVRLSRASLKSSQVPMASSSLLVSCPPSTSSCGVTRRRAAILHLSLPTSRLIRPRSLRRLRSPFFVAATLAESGSPKPLGQGEEKQPDLRPLLQELAGSFDLPSDYLAKLPRDLRLDLNDAAFDLSNGAVLEECGQELGELLLNLSKAWEQAETSTSRNLANQFLSIELPDYAKPALGKRLVSAGRRFTTMGSYGKGELQRIATALSKTGKVLLANPAVETAVKPKVETRTLKFGELQVELTPEKAYTGAAISFVFGILSWGLVQGIQSAPESSLQHSNDNALLLAKSLRGALLAIGYSSTVLSAVASGGLLLLGRQLSSEVNVKDP